MLQVKTQISTSGVLTVIQTPLRVSVGINSFKDQNLRVHSCVVSIVFPFDLSRSSGFKRLESVLMRAPRKTTL